MIRRAADARGVSYGSAYVTWIRTNRAIVEKTKRNCATLVAALLKCTPVTIMKSRDDIAREKCEYYYGQKKQNINKKTSICLLCGWRFTAYDAETKYLQLWNFSRTRYRSNDIALSSSVRRMNVSTHFYRFPLPYFFL